MPFATPADLTAHLGEREATAISDRSNAGAVDETELARLLALAEDEAVGYVGRRYAVPLLGLDGQAAAAPAALKRAVIDIARYHATGTEIMGTEGIRNRYRDAVKWLQSVADGTVKLGDLALAGAGGPAPTGGATAVRTGGKTFGDLSEAL
jgi:phage gp36-like protein